MDDTRSSAWPKIVSSVSRIRHPTVYTLHFTARHCILIALLLLYGHHPNFRIPFSWTLRVHHRMHIHCILLTTLASPSPRDCSVNGTHARAVHRSAHSRRLALPSDLCIAFFCHYCVHASSAFPPVEYSATSISIVYALPSHVFPSGV